jgi:hypothetical protein
MDFILRFTDGHMVFIPSFSLPWLTYKDIIAFWWFFILVKKKFFKSAITKVSNFSEIF